MQWLSKYTKTFELGFQTALEYRVNFLISLISAIAEITDSFWDFNSMPMDIYNQWMRQIGVFILPIFVITNYPPMFLLGKMPPIYLAWAMLIPVILLGLVRWV